MITQIGIVAGEIWQHLDKNGSSDLDGLVSSTGRSRELVLMSLGWLAREGHIQLEDPKSGYKASLKPSTV